MSCLRAKYLRAAADKIPPIRKLHAITLPKTPK